MPIGINGSGTITGISAGGLPDAIVDAADLNGGTPAAGLVLAATSSSAMAWRDALVQDTAKASTSGTSVDFTGIPAWVHRITVMFNGVSTNGTSAVQIQLGDSGGFETSGYLGATGVSANGGTASGTLSAGFLLDGNTTQAATSTRYGLCTIANVTGNTWVAHGAVGETTNSRVQHVAGAKALSDVLTQLRITTVNGTDTFDAGTINIMYE